MRASNGVSFEWCLNSDATKCQPRPYSELEIARHLSKVQLQILLQQLYDEVHGIGFRVMGHDKDLFHGHFLHGDNFRGFLYHTQELAALYERQNSDHPFAYLNRQTRNWLQFIDSAEIVNAGPFISEQGATSEEFQLYRESYTINQRMLDIEKVTGSNQTLDSLQITFYQIICATNEEQPNNILRINTQESFFCLIIN